MKNSWNHLHPLFKKVSFNLFWLRPVIFEKKISEKNSWNQLNTWKNLSLSIEPLKNRQHNKQFQMT